MNQKQLVIAIDGPAASGKSTTARLVAERLGYTYIDTGAMYRAVTYASLRDGIDPADREEVERRAAELSIDLQRQSDGSLRVTMDGEDVSMPIRTPEVTSHVSLVSSYSGVRRCLVALQQEMGKKGGVVIDGRDIGTVVFPDADLKIFMVADIKARAERRHSELQNIGTEIPDLSVDGLAEQIAERDRFDSTREISPLTRADDAIVIDTSNLTVEAQVERVVELAEGRMRGKDEG